MNKIVRFSSITVALMFLLAGVMCNTPASAADSKVAVINLQKVLVDSEIGKESKAKVEKRMEELKASFKKDQDALQALQDEIDKKSTAWSEEKKREKAMELQKMRRDLRVKQDDANMEIKNLQEKHMAPILKKLETVVTEVAKAKGFTLVVPRTNVLYFDESVDVTEEATKAMNAKTK